eukprot:241050-Prymnesium_polylepis.2
MSRQQKVVHAWTHARGTARLRRAVPLTAGASRAGAQGMRASRAGRLAEGRSAAACAIRASFFPKKVVFSEESERFDYGFKAVDYFYYFCTVAAESRAPGPGTYRRTYSHVPVCIARPVVGRAAVYRAGRVTRRHRPLITPR